MTRVILLLISSYVMVFGAGVWHGNLSLVAALFMLSGVTFNSAVDHYKRHR